LSGCLGASPGKPDAPVLTDSADRKERAVYPDHITREDFVKRSAWAEVSLGYARAHDRDDLARLLGAVREDVEFEGKLVSLLPGEYLRPAKEVSPGEVVRNSARGTESEEDAKRRKREEENVRDRLAAWKLFVEAEFRGLRLRQEGQLGRLLGEPLAGESAAALERLAEEDRRQALSGLVALMSNGRTAYKRVEDLREGDMPARSAADRLRTTWLKERRDGWLVRGMGA
jgi:hypothetical protein